jgi:hypothetical protein
MSTIPPAADGTPFPNPHGVPRRLVRALVTAVQTRRASPELREAICGYVAQARAAGIPQEEMLATAQALMRRAVVGQRIAPDTDALAERILEWCVEEYSRLR